MSYPCAFLPRKASEDIPIVLAKHKVYPNARREDGHRVFELDLEHLRTRLNLARDKYAFRRLVLQENAAGEEVVQSKMSRKQYICGG